MDFTKLKDFMGHLTSWRMPGNSIVVYKDDKVIFSHSTGYADLENKVKMTGDELLNIYSCSKLTTVVAALQLYERIQRNVHKGGRWGFKAGGKAHYNETAFYPYRGNEL